MYEIEMTVVGTVVSTVQQRTLADGTPRAFFRVMCKERRYSRADDTWHDGEPVYLSVNCWRALAGHVTESLKNGDPVIVRGRFHARTYVQDGHKGVALEVEANAVGPDLGRSTAVVTRSWRRPTAEQSAEPPVEQPAEAGAAPGAGVAEARVLGLAPPVASKPAEPAPVESMQPEQARSGEVAVGVG